MDLMRSKKSLAPVYFSWLTRAHSKKLISPTGQELVTRSLRPGLVLVETAGSPMFLGNPDCVFALLYDPGGPTASGLCDAAARPPF